MTDPRRDTNWSGWGDPMRRTALDATALGVLRERIGDLEPWPLAAALPDFELPERHPLPQAVIDAVGEGAVFASREDRLRHAHGSGYVDLARLRSGRLEHAPDAVIVPADAAAVGRLIDACAAHGVAVVPFGGGTSVVGGVEPLRGPHEALISLDLTALREVVVDETSLTARLGAGLRGPEAEAALAARGLTLGHFPQSFEYATIGGFAATRSAGQASSGYGRFDSLVSSVRLLSPAGNLSTLETPHTAAGPALREVVIGSEGGARRDPRRHRPGPPGTAAASLRGVDGTELRGGDGDRPCPRPGPGATDVDPRLRRGGDGRFAGAVRAARGRREGLRHLPEGAPAGGRGR